MPIITIASAKGGVGKTTLGVNLAVGLQQRGYAVALLDADRQGSALQWNEVREAIRAQDDQLPAMFTAHAQGEALIELAVNKSNQGAWVIIDSAGADNKSVREALLRSDFILTASAPSPVELWQIETLLKIVDSLERIQRRKIPTLLVINRAPTHPSVKSVQDALDFLNENLICPTHIFNAIIKDRIVFQHSFREGKSVLEYAPADANAKAEINALCDEFIETINNI